MLHLTLALVPLLCPPQDGLDQLAVGHFVEVRGGLTEAGRFQAEKIELQMPNDDVLIGAVDAKDSNQARFQLLGQTVETAEETVWSNVDHRIAGKRVKVEGSWKGPRKFSAKKVANRGEGRDRIGGRISDWKRVEGGWEARIMIFSVFVPDGVEFEHELPVASYDKAEERTSTDVDLVDLERDEDDAFGEGFLLTKDLRWTGQLEGKVTHEQDFDLANNVQNDEEDRTDHEFSSRIRLVWTPTGSFWGLIEGRFSERYRRDEDKGIFDGENDHSGSIGEAWLQWRDVKGWRGFDITVGRQDFDDPREWIYDENLDGLRLTWLRPDWRLDVSGTTIVNGGQRNENSNNAIAYLSNNDSKRHLAAWTLFRSIDDLKNDNGDIVAEQEHSWYWGARAIGEWVPDNDLWADFAYQTGERAGRDVSAWAYDVGTTWEPSFAEDWYFTLGYALGTGDDSTTGTDGTFRQTGYQDNNGRFGGVTSFNYYGELAGFELSNMGIFTFGVGKILAEKTSLDLVFHNYTQDVPLAAFSPGPSIEADIDVRPSGLDADLGNEIDLILGYRALANWDLEIVTALFDPGSAFLEEDSAWMAKVQLRYRF